MCVYFRLFNDLPYSSILILYKTIKDRSMKKIIIFIGFVMVIGLNAQAGQKLCIDEMDANNLSATHDVFTLQRSCDGSKTEPC